MSFISRIVGSKSAGPSTQAERDEKLLADAREQIAAYLAEDAALAAGTLAMKLRATGAGLRLEPQQYAAAIKALVADGRHADGARLLADWIALQPNESDSLRLRLAQLCVDHLGRPGRALDLIVNIDPEKLSDPECLLAQELVTRAEGMQDDGAVELDDAEW
ncbi:MAG: hypothetical protein AAFV43_01455 [Planctomycetota bacterium]